MTSILEVSILSAMQISIPETLRYFLRLFARAGRQQPALSLTHSETDTCSVYWRFTAQFSGDIFTSWTHR